MSSLGGQDAACSTALLAIGCGLLTITKGGTTLSGDVAGVALRLLVWLAIAATAWRRLLHGDAAAAQARSGDPFM